MVPPLLVLALEFYRAPLRFPHLTDPAQPLPPAFGDWLRDALAAAAPARLAETAEALAAEPAELEAALVFFVRQALLLPQADHYRVLGLSRRAPGDRIREHYSLLVRIFHPDRSQGDEGQGIALTARINSAYRTLRDPDARRRYDLRLPAMPSAGAVGSDVQHFFRPTGTQLAKAGRSGPRAWRFTGRGLALWATAAGGVVALVLLVAGEPAPPRLQGNSQAGREPTAGPAYLQQHSALGPETPRTSEKGDPGEAWDRSRSEDPSRRATGDRGAGEGATPLAVTAVPPSAGPPAPPPDVDWAAAHQLLKRFEHAFASGDLGTLLALFAAPGEVNGAQGTAAILQELSRIVRAKADQHPYLSDLHWLAMSDRRLIGNAILRLGDEVGSASGDGIIRVELVPWQDDYRISRLSYQPGPH